MERPFQFSKVKFCSLSEKQQHKKCFEQLLEAYRHMLLWMGRVEEAPRDEEELADRIHFHRKKAGVFLKEHSLLPAISTLDTKEPEPILPIAIFLDRIRSLHNIGSILRTIEAFRIGTPYFSPGSLPENGDLLKKSAMGCEKWISWENEAPLETLIRPIIVLETAPSQVPYYDFSFPDEFTLVLGNEEQGVSKKSLSLADAIVHIPLHGKKNSLNVACCFAAVAAEISRQKRKKTTTKSPV
jgi:tRNA G18 (ribose-2'-O)-methylase SpoU